MENSYKEILEALLARRDLSAAAMRAAMRGILEGVWTPAQTAGFLIAAKVKGETPEELAAAAAAMRDMATAVQLPDDIKAVDTCGTGGDGAGLFNVSTAAAFVAAAAGAKVAKHGNRALSGATGSADVLAELGVPLDLPPEKIAAMIQQTGFGFMFAPAHHPAMRHAAAPRKELGVRTMFNLLGPMLNPAGARRQVVGVYSPDLLVPYAETLAAAGSLRAMVVHGGGLDEITIVGDTDIAEVNDGAVRRWTLSPADASLEAAPAESLGALRAKSAAESAKIIRDVLDGSKGPARDIVLLNAAAALMVSELADNIADGVAQAAAAVDKGRAADKLREVLQAAKN